MDALSKGSKSLKIGKVHKSEIKKNLTPELNSKQPEK